jgi:DNA-binding NtrC family response regulator
MPTTVAVLNSNEDVVEMLRVALEGAGFNTVSAHVPEIKRGREDFIAFLEQHDPAVIVYDIAPPYRENWIFLKLVLNTEASKHRKFVITTANRDLLLQAAGQEIAVFELSEKPYSLNSIVEAVQRNVKSE